MGTRRQSARPGQAWAAHNRMEISRHIGSDRFAKYDENRGAIMEKKKAAEAAQKVTLNLEDNSGASQRARVIQALRSGPKTTLELRANSGVLMPASRIFELNERGWHIAKVTVRAATADGVEHYGIARYFIAREPKAANEYAIAPKHAANDSDAGVQV